MTNMQKTRSRVNRRNLLKSCRVAVFVMCSRWLLAPYYIGLSSLIVLYFFKFARELAETFVLIANGVDSILINVLHLLENVMIANLIVMIMLGGFSLFVQPFDENQHQLAWLQHIGATQLKVKFGLSLVSVSSIYLLEALVEPDKDIVKSLVIHMTFVASTLAMAWADSLMCKTQVDRQSACQSSESL